MVMSSDGHRHRNGALIGLMLFALLVAAAAVAVAWASGTRAKPGSASVAARISLDSGTVRSGGIVRGKLVFKNSTSTVKILVHGCKTDGLYAMGFRASDGNHYDPAFSLVGCDENAPVNELVAKPGKTTYRFAVRASYTECGQDPKNQLPRSSKYWSPLCLKDHRRARDIMPPLPAGRYTVRFIPNGKWTGPHIKPASLVLTGKS